MNSYIHTIPPPGMAGQKWATRLDSLDKLDPDSPDYETKTDDAYCAAMGWATCAVGEACNLKHGQPPPTKELGRLGHRFARVVLQRDYRSAKKLEQQIREEAAKPSTREALVRQEIAMARHALIEHLYEAGYALDEPWGIPGKELGLSEQQCKMNVGEYIAGMSARKMWNLLDRIDRDL